MADVQEVAKPNGPFIVLRIVWGGIPPEACYGPWEVKADGSHLASIHDFIAKWSARNGEPSSCTIYSVFAPGEVDNLQEPGKAV